MFYLISIIKSYLFFKGFEDIDLDCNKYFNYKKNTNINKICERLLNKDNEIIFNALEVFSKNHYKYRDILYYNLQFLELRYEDDLEKKMNVVGYSYVNEDTSLIVYKLEDCLYHEFLHLSSTYYDKEKDIIHSGFYYSDCKRNIIIGNGINEGYTEYLCIKEKFNGKYFYDIDEEKEKLEMPYYCFNACLAEQLEIIIGKDKMEELYFKADLESLIKELSKYSDEKSIYKFLKNVDYSILGNDTNSLFICQRILDAQSFIFEIARNYMPERIKELEKIRIVNTMYLEDDKLNSVILPKKVINEYLEIKKEANIVKKKVAMWN